jgi:hypothetical protein
VHVLNQLFDWLCENRAIGGTEGAMVAGEICYSLGALCLLEFAVDMLEMYIPGKRGVGFTNQSRWCWK